MTWTHRRDGYRFGETEVDFCLRFGLSVNRIFDSETEETLGTPILRSHPRKSSVILPCYWQLPLHWIRPDDVSSCDPSTKTVNCLISLCNDDVTSGPPVKGLATTTWDWHLDPGSSWNRISWRITTQHFWPIRERPTHNPEFVDSRNPQTPSHQHVQKLSSFCNRTVCRVPDKSSGSQRKHSYGAKTENE